MTNRFKALDLIDNMLEELWMEVHNTVQEAVIKSEMSQKEKENKFILTHIYGI